MKSWPVGRARQFFRERKIGSSGNSDGAGNWPGFVESVLTGGIVAYSFGGNNGLSGRADCRFCLTALYWGAAGRHEACPYGLKLPNEWCSFWGWRWPGGVFAAAVADIVRPPIIGRQRAGTRPARKVVARGLEHRWLSQPFQMPTMVGQAKGGVAGGIPPHKGGPKARPHNGRG